jgi:hypothetical protein
MHDESSPGKNCIQHFGRKRKVSPLTATLPESDPCFTRLTPDWFQSMSPIGYHGL